MNQRALMTQSRDAERLSCGALSHSQNTKKAAPFGTAFSIRLSLQ